MTSTMKVVFITIVVLATVMAQDPVAPTAATTTVPSAATTIPTAPTPGPTASTTVSTASTTVPTTTTTVPTTTTTPIPTDPVEYCKHKGPGRFRWPRDTTCKTYVYCYVITAGLTGAIYTCAGTTTFNPTLQLCDTSKALCQ